MKHYLGRKFDLCLANCYFAHDSSGFSILLPFFDKSGRSFYPVVRQNFSQGPKRAVLEKHWSTPNAIVCTVKRSIAAIASRWLRRLASAWRGLSALSSSKGDPGHVHQLSSFVHRVKLNM
jgi:hypothetical protein